MKLLDFPQVRQTFAYDCAASALQAVLVYYGIEVRGELLIKFTKTSAASGATIKNICQTIDKFKLRYSSAGLTLSDLKNYLDKKIPVMILLQAWQAGRAGYARDYKNGHWVVAIGYARDRLFFEDPNAFEWTFLKNKELAVRWHGQDQGRPVLNHGIAVFGKKPADRSNKIIWMP